LIWGGQGHPDADGDGLSDAREAAFGTKPNVKDTCGLSLFVTEGGNYSLYAGYADQELFCRWKVIGIQGDASKDWGFSGAQSPNKSP
jgi:hypothetical protein